ncbi:peptidase C15 [Alkalihalobacillus alcalophilus ATCC 27647 = CGMCC 1.3604]|uniref:Pyroglutamyl-peptidase I n=1 Tax=Alkalihalobacillus alcalophilus ATCC 27647 = CGMCC 1.3604 TaxID=1218173 RepID=A0A094WI16_ALKAL|nr:pyroglutamyl-peptidase I [Alkalihalobacillus alcalophilus]KGA95548.1 peptidase C15 [Alkalihalobacillus alcalophilus ATCC 27647 = CGMCC 1.3604]MED1562469.1 pyroglutamyl-peptidase I [Alkalihalobacillus alcalophilus]THG89700.1 peptidase C15 [Alkalihalobacillus alcalophilus ATCC 27647 = CGMCC 1.3604]
MKRLLLTGFEPFLDFSINPTMKIVEELEGEEVGPYIITSKVLSVDFELAGKQLVKYIDENKPDAIISLGLAGGRYKITPERVAINVNHGLADNNGHSPMDEVIQAEGPDGLFSTLPISLMVSQLINNGLPAEISNTAGTYLCNHVMYQALYYTKSKNLSIPAGFIHIPASHELAIKHGRIPSWSHEDLKKAIIICIKSLMNS